MIQQFSGFVGRDIKGSEDSILKDRKLFAGLNDERIRALLFVSDDFNSEIDFFNFGGKSIRPIIFFL